MSRTAAHTAKGLQWANCVLPSEKSSVPTPSTSFAPVEQPMHATAVSPALLKDAQAVSL